MNPSNPKPIKQGVLKPRVPKPRPISTKPARVPGMRAPRIPAMPRDHYKPRGL